MNQCRRAIRPGPLLLLLVCLAGRVKAQPQVPIQMIERQAAAMGTLTIADVQPLMIAPGGRLSVTITLLGDRQPVDVKVEIGGVDAEAESVRPQGAVNRYVLDVRVPALKTGERAEVEVSVGQFRARSFQKIRIAEPLRILKVEPRVVEPGGVVEISIPGRTAMDDFQVSLDRTEAEKEKAPPGSLVIRVPEKLPESGWSFDWPLHRTKNPALVVFSNFESSEPFAGLTVREPLIRGSVAGLLLLGLVAVAVLYLWSTGAGPRAVQWVLRRRAASAEPRKLVGETEEKQGLPPPDPPDGLVECCATRECVIYVGAGLSASSGYLVWRSLIGEALEWTIDNRLVEREFGEALRDTLREGDADLVADSIVGRLQGREHLLHKFLQDLYLLSDRGPSRAHRLVGQIPFCAALTTNFDELLEKTFGKDKPVYTPEDTDALREDLAARRFFLLKLYGSLRQPATLIVSPAQYRESMAGNRAFSQAMEGLFFSRTILFAGASLEGIESYLAELAFRGIARRQHYALVDVTGKAWRAKADLLSRRYGIQVIPYTPSTPAHPEVLEFLTRLRDRVKDASKRSLVRTAGPELAMGKSQALTRVRLRNIGAFEELDAELDPSWTLFLGDNGVGKSTVLKAIAAAISGKDAEPYAGTLIRSSSRTAEIVLSTGTTEYMTTLVARENGQAEIEVRPSHPLETEGWLAIGFPPLRTVTWTSSKGPGPEGKRRPTTEDLLPLLKGGVDPRLDELKQWLVNLDYWSKSEPPGPGNQYIRLRDQFFEMVRELTEGVPVRFSKVDEFSHQVTVVTDDGPVPIEALSQGTASLVGWTGFLLQRLHEVYGQQRTDPLQRHALVLLDEIDAHMHPSWQQSLVERLGKAFPAVQFIASTHSPLIAGSLPRASILRFWREEGRVLAERPPESYKGWRVDQILVNLFGLQSGRESETQRLLVKYTELAARDDLGEDEERDLQEIAATLKVRMPNPVEREEARKSFDLMQATMREHLRTMDRDERERILTEAKVQLQEAVTGSRRPQ